jgi:hypothetical protein
MEKQSREDTMPQACEHTRVIKKISAMQPGALKLARRYGKSLVCVRYRQSLDGSTRYTTVELLVEQAPTLKRKPDSEMVEVKLRGGEADLRHNILSNGGHWDPQALVWRLSRGLARRLRLINRLIAK